MTPNVFLKSRSGIYGIRNKLNNKIYVGKTKCMTRRCHQYLYDFENRNIGHLNDYLHRAMTKIGISNFEFFPLEFCGLENIAERELHWMTVLKSTNRTHGYNLRMDSATGMHTSLETSEKISNNLKTQWANGVRKNHSQKLKDKWNSDPQRKLEQGVTFSRLKTKYSYEVHHPNGEIEVCLYQRLCELELQTVMSNFHRKNIDDVTCKGYRIIRHARGEE